MYLPTLKPGAHIALISPSSPTYDIDRREMAISALEAMGYAVKVYQSVKAKRGYLSGSDELRAGDVMEAFCDDEIDGIVCMRGGYGMARILPLLDFNLIARHPKPFVGYSDITALHLAIHRYSHFATYHGPMAFEFKPDTDPAIITLWQQMLTGTACKSIRNPDGTDFTAMGKKQCVEGVLMGGNLTVFCSLIGTAYMPEMAGKLLLIEDIGEAPYRIDGMLTQLRNRGLLDQIRGLVLGDFTDCEAADPERSLSLSEILCALLPPELPVLANAHIGHGIDKITLPLGARYRMDTCSKTLTLLGD